MTRPGGASDAAEGWLRLRRQQSSPRLLVQQVVTTLRRSTAKMTPRPAAQTGQRQSRAPASPWRTRRWTQGSASTRSWPANVRQAGSGTRRTARLDGPHGGAAFVVAPRPRGEDTTAAWCMTWSSQRQCPPAVGTECRCARQSASSCAGSRRWCRTALPLQSSRSGTGSTRQAPCSAPEPGCWSARRRACREGAAA